MNMVGIDKLCNTSQSACKFLSARAIACFKFLFPPRSFISSENAGSCTCLKRLCFHINAVRVTLVKAMLILAVPRQGECSREVTGPSGGRHLPQPLCVHTSRPASQQRKPVLCGARGDDIIKLSQPKCLICTRLLLRHAIKTSRRV